MFKVVIGGLRCQLVSVLISTKSMKKSIVIKMMIW